MEKKCVVIAAAEFADQIRAALEPLDFAVHFVAGDPSRPLDGVVSADAIDDRVRDYLASNAILAAKDLGRLDLNELASAPGVTRPALTRFVRELARSNRYPDAAALQDFLVRRGIFT
ncbi:MAG TPA: hypothetical protein VF846_15310 [Thermoanaerobaculia bacterium]